MSRLDHIALRVKDRYKTAQFYIECLGYKIATEFPIVFDDGSKAECLVLEPPEKINNPFFIGYDIGYGEINGQVQVQSYLEPSMWHLAPEIFISNGSPDSIVGKWVAARGGIGGIHHMAYQVDSVDKVMSEWKAKGYAEFSSDPITCYDEEGNQTLKQVFTVPSELTGYVIELIERGADGFCKDSVRQLMETTR